MQPKVRISNFTFFSKHALRGRKQRAVSDRHQSFSPSLVALFSQVVATLIFLMLVAPLLASFELAPPLIVAALIQGGIAAFLGSRLGLASWWLPINLLFSPALVSTLSFDVAPSWFLAAFVLLFLIYWSVFRSQVPLYLSSRKAWAAVAVLLPGKAGIRFLDLGAGLGGMLSYLDAQHPDGKFSGMEIAPLPFALGWTKKIATRGNYSLLWGDFWQYSLAGQDVVYAYLSPVPMARLWRKVCEEMPSGSRFISNTFSVPGVEPEKVVELDDFHHSRLYVYRVPARHEMDASA
ncbi:MAG: class I SAM-dependent methyltransferase [Gammaproteobacteria bacterium]|nr:class I SAM-dependent methyltransferase [Gammaproteobacteria bacterium]MBU1980679.1 class I SAM-dependent methyltransferase [Gammaproteobacteria bacterium]